MRFSLLSMLLIALAGCDSSPKLCHLSGEVTYGGKPLPAGVIFFETDITQNIDGPQGYAMIKDGKYSTKAEGGKGIVGGPYLIRIEGFDGKPGNELPLGRPLFTDYQTKADFPKQDSIKNFEVPAKK